jgi:3-oxoacyl-[acyl-carrier-protein] synthase II
MKDRYRVVVTGVGTVSALGVGGLAAVEEALDRGSSGISPVRGFAIGASPSRLAAEVDPASLEAHVERDAARRLSRICQLAVAAARLAVAESGVGPGQALGVAVGTEHGDFRSSEAFAAGFLRRGPTGLSPMIFPNTVMNSMAAQVAIAAGAQGPTVTVNQATVAGDLAVARATELVASGQARAMLAGGVDEICPSVYRQLASMGVLSPMGGEAPEGCRPFARDHNGPVLGEGATFLVLETAEAAHERRAREVAEVLGAAWMGIPVAPHTAPRRRRDRCSPVPPLLARLGLRAADLGACFGSGNGDPAVDDWEQALLAADLYPGGGAGFLCPPRSLAPLFGQHGGLGVLRTAAAAVEALRGRRPILVHGLARGGCRTASVIGAIV